MLAFKAEPLARLYRDWDLRPARPRLDRIWLLESDLLELFELQLWVVGRGPERERKARSGEVPAPTVVLPGSGDPRDPAVLASTVRRSRSRYGQVMTDYTEHLHLGYTAARLFDLIADVERYPEFLPWVIAARIRHRSGRTVCVDMTIGTRFLCKRFSTVAVLDRPLRIDISSHDPLFERFSQRWDLAPATEGGTNIEYRVDFKFRSRLLQRLIGASFSDQAAAMVAAFRDRARQLYGTPSSPELIP